MMFKRVKLASANNGGLDERARQGAGLFDMINWIAVATDAARVLSLDDISSGGIQFTGFTAGRNLTTPTAAAILAAAPDMDIGDSFSFFVSVTTAFAATYVAGAGVTLAGRATTPASSWSIVTVKKLSATTVEWRVS